METQRQRKHKDKHMAKAASYHPGDLAEQLMDNQLDPLRMEQRTDRHERRRVFDELTTTT